MRTNARSGLTTLALLALLAAGCRQDMHDQPKYIPLRESTFFSDARSARPIVEGTVARGHLRYDDLLYTGRINGTDATVLPFPVDARVMARGRERFNIYCSPCHGRLGDGKGMIVQRGYKQPTSFHDPRLRASRVGYFFNVMTEGFGVMPSYASQIPVEDRWKIASYVRVLQYSQGAPLSDLSAAERQRVEEAERQATPPAQPATGHGAKP